MRVQTSPAKDELVRLRLQAQKEQRFKEALLWLQQTGAVVENGHFRFGKGETEKHGCKRVVTRRLFSQPFVSKWFMPALADAIPEEVLDQVEIVAGPPTFGTLIASALTDYLNSQRDMKRPAITALYLGRDWDQVYSVHKDDLPRLATQPKVLLVDDVRHRGLTFVACAKSIAEAGGVVVATAELIDRSMTNLPMFMPNFFVAAIEPDQLYTPGEKCPMCAAGIELTQY